jgi:hypothetical protein
MSGSTSVRPKQYGLVRGVKGDGVTDDTAAIKAALARGENISVGDGRFLITDKITFFALQFAKGNGVKRSIFVVDVASFNMSATAVLEFTALLHGGGAGEGGGIDGIGIEFVQPDVSSRAAVNKYPPAIDILATRPKFGRVRVSGAWDGVDCTGNIGGAYFEFLEVGALNEGLVIDGALDFFHIGHYHFWPFGIADKANLYNDVYSDSETIAARIPAVDGLDIGTLSTFRGRVIVDNGFGNIGTLQLDGRHARLDQSNGHLVVGDWYSTSDADDDYAIRITGGELNTGPYHTLQHISGTAAYIQVAGGELTLGKGISRSGSINAPAVSVTAGVLDLGEHNFSYGTNQNRTAPFIDISGGRVTVKNPRFLDKGIGSGDAISVTGGSWHDIEVDALLGWGFTIPTVAGTSKYVIGPVQISEPTVAFQTVGDFVPSYSVQSCRYTIDGKRIHFKANLIFDVNAYATAAGAFVIKLNIPYEAVTGSTVTLGNLKNVVFGADQLLFAEVQGGDVFIRTANSGAANGNIGVSGVPASATDVAVTVSGSYEF